MATPSTDQIYNNIVAQMQSAINQRVPLLPKSFLRVLAKALAAVYTTLYKYGGFQFLQIFVASATINDTEILGRTVSPLKEWGRLIGAGEPKQATYAELMLDVTVTTGTGQIPLGTQLTGTANGVLYISTRSLPLAPGVVSLPVLAASDASGSPAGGVVGNLAEGSLATFVQPITGVNRTAVVSEALVEGVEPETEAAYRQRVTDWFQKRPQGGAKADYEGWAELVPGVANAYPYTGLSLGTVDVYIEAADTVDGIPGAPLLEAVAEAIEFDQDGRATRRPVNAFVNVRPITRAAFTVEVVGLSVDNPGSVQASITAAVQAYFLSREPFIPGVSVLPRNDRVTVTAIAGIIDDIVASVGGIFTSVVLKRGGVNVVLYALDIGEKVKATVSYV